MTQTALNFTRQPGLQAALPTSAQAVGLLYDDDAVTLRFMETLEWGRPSRQVRLGRDVAEQLRRLLADELDDAAWAEKE